MQQSFLHESFWQREFNNPRVRAFLAQTLVLAALVWVLWVAVSNTARNLEAAGIASGFGFLNEPARFDISFSFIEYSRDSTYFRAYLVGLINTLVMTGICIASSTAVGFVTAVLRLSPNWLMRAIAGIYIEVARNIPLLLLILFVYLAILGPLPGPHDALEFKGVIFLCNRGLIMPRPIWQPQAWAFLSALGLALGGGALLNIWAGKRRRRTGEGFPAFRVSLAALILLPLLAALLAGSPAHWDLPVMGGFNFRGGFTILPEFLAMSAAMTIYMGAFIGENIRAGIEAVPRGQVEAAAALGLRQSKILRLVVIPQAMRVIIPPVTSQYLTLAKNISLGVVIGYPDIVSVFAGTTLNQTGQAVEVVAMTMGTYLALSVLISLFMNWYNTRFILVER
jgi:general L-amino acid transport system permease protein